MATTLEQVEALAMELSHEERLKLAIRLVEGQPEESPEEVERLWKEEIEHRLREMDEGKGVSIDGDAALEEAEKVLNEKIHSSATGS